MGWKEMTKPKPLKDEVVAEFNQYFPYGSVKSAVRGLLEELKEKQANAKNEGYEEGISDAIELIKKWLPDAVEEDTYGERKW